MIRPAPVSGIRFANAIVRSHVWRALLLILLLMLTAVACPSGSVPDDPPVTVDRQELLSDLEFLSSDELQGRRTGTPGNRMAQRHIESRFEKLGLQPAGESYRQVFDHVHPESGERFEGAVNLIGLVEGRERPERYLVVTAHYDHLGVIDSEIYNGADDNASGTAGLLAAARHFTEYPPRHSILFIATDAEEQRLGGAYHFVEHPTVPLERIVLNVNMDMISRNDRDELYVAGTSHYPFLRHHVEAIKEEAPVDLLFGYDHPEAPQDWTFSSDHGPFHLKGIPFLYFGVEDHEYYHHPDDRFETIPVEFYTGAVETILRFLRHADTRLEEIAERSGRSVSLSSDAMR